MDVFDRLRLAIGGGMLGDAVTHLLVGHSTIYGALAGMTLVVWFLSRNRI